MIQYGPLSCQIVIKKNKDFFSVQNTEMFFLLVVCTIKKYLLLTVYNFRIVYKNGGFKEYS